MMLSALLSEMMKMLQIGFAAVGFVAFMGIVAWCAEPHYAEGRARMKRWWKDRGAWGLVGKDDGYGCLPESWERERGGRR